MAEFVEVSTGDGREPIYINPEGVTRIDPLGDECRVTMADGTQRQVALTALNLASLLGEVKRLRDA